jgi:hypothetical protein
VKGGGAGRAQQGQSRVITVRAKPRSSVSTLEREAAGTWLARLAAPPVDGEANAELIRLVARHFGCPKSAVSIVSGESARLKLVRIVGAYPEPADGSG